MSLPHFFLDEQILSSIETPRFVLRLSSEDRKHFNALRLQVGEHLAVIDADADYFECVVESLSREEVVVSIAQRLESAERPRITLFQSLAKSDKMDTVFRHATEVGVRAFVPLECSRSIVKLDSKKKATRAKRWQALIKSAAMQSGQSVMPHLYDTQTIKDACELLASFDALLIFWEEAPLSATIAKALHPLIERVATKNRTPSDSSFANPSADSDILNDGSTASANLSVGVVVGPEGGLSSEEVEMLCSYNTNAHVVTLGPSILRTETAGLLAPSLVMYELERA